MVARARRAAAAEEPVLQLFGLYKCLRDKVAGTVDPRRVLEAGDSPGEAERILASAPIVRPKLLADMRRRKAVEVPPSMIPSKYAEQLDHWVFRRAADFEAQRLVRDGVRTWLVGPDDTIRPASRFGQ